MHLMNVKNILASHAFYSDMISNVLSDKSSKQESRYLLYNDLRYYQWNIIELTTPSAYLGGYSFLLCSAEMAALSVNR